MNENHKVTIHNVFYLLSEILVNPEDPFKEDFLSRHQSIETLTEMLKKTETPFVLGVHGVWGDGKTCFLKMWKYHLEKIFRENLSYTQSRKNKDENRCVFIDAWKSDFMKNSLGVILVEIQNTLKINNLNVSAEKLLVAASSLVNMGGVMQNLCDASKKPSFMNEYIEYKKILHIYKNILEKEATEHRQKTGYPLFIFIDELDRCRPPFALDFLENIKHIFNVKDILFVIALNLKHLEKVILSEYGGINGKLYLEKFFNRIHFIENNKGIWHRAFLSIDNSLNAESVKPVFDVFTKNVSLRRQEHIFSCYKTTCDVYYKGAPNEEISLILSFLLCLKENDPDLYNEILHVSYTSNIRTIQYNPYNTNKTKLNSLKILEFYCEMTGYPVITNNSIIAPPVFDVFNNYSNESLKCFKIIHIYLVAIHMYLCEINPNIISNLDIYDSIKIMIVDVKLMLKQLQQIFQIVYNIEIFERDHNKS